MISSRKKVHENYHKKTHAQFKFIKDNNFTYRHLIAGISEYLKPKMKILDIGCGAGTLDFYFAKKGFDITGIDISSNAIDSCIKTSKNLGIKNVKFKVVDFPNKNLNEKFDFIIFTEVVEHLEDDKLALEKIHNLLSPGGGNVFNYSTSQCSFT